MDKYRSGTEYQKRALNICVSCGEIPLFKSQRVMFGKVDFGPFGNGLAKVDIVTWDPFEKQLHLISVKSSTSAPNINAHNKALYDFWQPLYGSLRYGLRVDIWHWRKNRKDAKTGASLPGAFEKLRVI